MDPVWTMNAFKLESEVSPKGDQRWAIDALTEGVHASRNDLELQRSTFRARTDVLKSIR